MLDRRLSWSVGCGALGIVACSHPPAAPAPGAAPAAQSAPLPGAASSAAGSTAPADPAPVGAGTPPGPAGATCGGLAGLRCQDGLFCDYPLSAHCGAADQSGTCQPKPEMCTRIYKAVCGCDDKTYGNACEAQSAGVSLASEGECGKH